MKKNKQHPKEIFLQRLKCDCIAQKHELINNCISCGKIVCAQQGQGPCLYCGAIVTRPDNKFIVNDEALFPTLTTEERNKISKERSQAIIHKDTLVARDKSTNMVQNIYDQSVDYYDVSQNQWLDEQSRQNAIDKLLDKEKYVESQQLKTKVYFDPITGQFVTEEFEFDEQSFRDEGKKFMQEKQKLAYSQKMKKANNTDQRMLKNEKVKQLFDGFRHGIEKGKKVPEGKKITDLVLEEEQTEV